MHAYNFNSSRYDIGLKQGFLEATVEYTLRRSELKEDFAKYLEEKILKKL